MYRFKTCCASFPVRFCETSFDSRDAFPWCRRVWERDGFEEGGIMVLMLVNMTPCMKMAVPSRYLMLRSFFILMCMEGVLILLPLNGVHHRIVVHIYLFSRVRRSFRNDHGTTKLS